VGYHFDWGVVFSNSTLRFALTGIQYTLLVSVASLAMGCIIGLLMALARVTKRAPFVQFAYGYTEFFRTTPLLVQIVWIFYVMPVLIGVNLDPITSGIIALGLNSGAFFAEIFRSGIESIGSGQRDAASVLGLSWLQTYRYVVLPQALRRVVAPTGSQFISLVKDSSMLSIIGVTELLYQFQTQVSNTFRPFELYTALAVVYFLLTYPMALGVSWLERRFPSTG
jgi:His/Glu/Gln/Arg/opine family amino acid ABC transporter permease subunit